MRRLIFSGVVGAGLTSYCGYLLTQNIYDYVSWGGLILGVFNIGLFIYTAVKK